MKTVSFPGGLVQPALGLGTWQMGESAPGRSSEIAAVRSAFEMGYRVIDTAEMYGEGGAEEVVGAALSEAIRAGTLRREDVFIVSKAYPHHASRRELPAACTRSLARLGVERIDLYLLHWRGSHPLAETVDAFERLRAQRRIERWGVSNFDVDDLEALCTLDGGDQCAANQVYYSLTERGPETALMPWMRARSMPLMAYSPIDQGALARDAGLRQLAAAKSCTPAQLALAWLLAQPGVMAIPKALRESHLRENLAAGEIALDAGDLAALEGLHPAPRRKRPLAMR
jgi:diketogulonate reductase-like aldo/keto reductase